MRKGKNLLVEYEGLGLGSNDYGRWWGCSMPASIAAIGVLVLGLLIWKDVKDARKAIQELKEKVKG